MTQVIRQPNEMMEDQIWEELHNSDDTSLYDAGYEDGIAKAIEIINSVRNTENVERVPFHLTMSAVVATLRASKSGE